ncbi:MAG TPA: HAMP domain-containing histidine kinase, partial [Campylobacterales bacterium]|nr:HAMP domain-containing histidine kinase [Campylobacterales bacterium]
NYRDNIIDITTIHRSIDELSSRLQKTIYKLQKHNQNLNSVIKSLSHDIKTPLSIMQGYLEELEDGLVDKSDLPKVIEILKKEIYYIDEISSDVICYIQSQDFFEKKETLHLKSFLHDEVCPLIKVEKEVKFKCEIPETLVIEFSTIALKKILINLLHNATKFTKVGMISVKADENRIMVEDTGLGIEINSAETIFNPFVSLDESRNRKKSGGFGLGLSIARNLAQSNGYELFLDTEYHDGARFILSLHSTGMVVSKA